MTPSQIRADVVAERISWIRSMTESARNLPIAGFEEFISDPRNVAAAESYLRRAVEALLDLGRHILSKGFGISVTEYKDIATRLYEQGVLSESQGTLLRRIAGYRNRMVHFYHEVSREELYELCIRHLDDIESLLEALVDWIRNHPDQSDQPIPPRIF